MPIAGLELKNEDEYDGQARYVFASEVAISAAQSEDIGQLAANEDWELTAPPTGQRLWTDDYSNILGAIIRRWSE